MAFSLSFFLIYFLVFLVLLALWIFRKKAPVEALKSYPRISILIAARDEEENILTCLAAIHRLDYPKEKLEVLVGDDHSTDHTRALVKSLLHERPYLQLLFITQTITKRPGKANVLAQLAQKATTDYFFITDADVEVPPTWVSHLLPHLTEGVGIVTGITTTKGMRFFDQMQALDWLFSLGLMQVISDRNVPASTMGNNMLIAKEAYDKVDGFAGIPFSITEDVRIFKEIVAEGYKTKNVYAPESLALSEPAATFHDFLQQRRRWMRGSTQLPWYLLLLLVLQAAYYPVWVPFVLHTSWFLAVVVFLLKLSLQSIFLAICVKRVGWKTSTWQIIFFEFYLLVTSLVLIVYFFVPTKLKWKGRRY